VDFADHSLVLPFSTRVTSMDGAISGLSGAPGRHAALELQGEIAESGEAHARGSIDVAQPTRFTDITVSFDNVVMPPLTPYSATFLGRRIAGGRLWLTLDYRLENERLLGRNEVTARDLELGDKLDVPGALELPLDLAVALLTDSEGRISVNVPITGDIGNPDFAVGPAIRAALGNVVRRMVSAPFRALAALLGGGKDQEELGRVAFDPGSAAIPGAERGKLDALAKALAERPQLRVTVHAPFDPERDAAALREDGLRRDLAQALGRPTPAGEPPPPVALDDPSTRRALARLAAERLPEGAGPAPAEHDAASRRALFERLVQAQPLPENAERVLAARRAQAITRSLAAAGVGEARLQAGSIEAASVTEGRIDARLALEAAPS
jgi:hypothetical protein